MTGKRIIHKILITGITGSGGSYLAKHIVNHCPDVSVHGIARWHSTSSQSNLAEIADKVTVHECDLQDFSAVFSVLRDVRPDAVFHLASHANVRASFINPLAVLQNNIMGTANLFESIRLNGIDPWIQLCSTSEVYGQVFPDEVPITEDQPIRASSPYAVSKVTQDLLGLTYFRSYKMKVIRTRMFAYINPRRADLFATSFARQVARIEAGLQKELVHGNLDSVRTMIDVRDAMEAYWLAIQKCELGEAYNIGGTTTISV
ncbi:MAG: GDP-mannose 4,6-dehydratase, partial [Kiritimatiellia bacterium]|nr:GDP-mannose 4,6-dehydratase [Kiritimatiellia bacterium]